MAGNSCARPKLKEAKVAHPGDTGVEEVRLFAINIASGAVCAADYPAMPTAANQLGWYFEDVAWWGSNNRHAYFIDTVRGDKCLRVVSFDTDTGSTQVLFEETSSNDTQVNLSNSHDSLPLHRYLPNTNELIWWSEGSGYGHLYLYDLNTGAVKTRHHRR